MRRRSTRSFSPGRRDIGWRLATCGAERTFPGFRGGRRIISGPGLHGTPRNSLWEWSSAYRPWQNHAGAWWNGGKCFLPRPFSGHRRKPDLRFATVPFCASVRSCPVEFSGTAIAGSPCSKPRIFSAASEVRGQNQAALNIRPAPLAPAAVTILAQSTLVLDGVPACVGLDAYYSLR
jgi:hypothetical protein